MSVQIHDVIERASSPIGLKIVAVLLCIIHPVCQGLKVCFYLVEGSLDEIEALFSCDSEIRGWSARRTGEENAENSKSDQEDTQHRLRFDQFKSELGTALYMSFLSSSELLHHDSFSLLLSNNVSRRRIQ